jgi:hypothetical protein
MKNKIKQYSMCARPEKTAGRAKAYSGEALFFLDFSLHGTGWLKACALPLSL